jgi:hypothetical protein
MMATALALFSAMLCATSIFNASRLAAAAEHGSWC